MSGRSVVAGRPCLELFRDYGPPGQREFLFLDEKRAYVVVKQMVALHGQPTWQLDVIYNPDGHVGWLPKSWEYVIRAGKDPQLVNSGRSRVISYEINPRIDDGDFDIVFPPKTRVNDETSQQEVQYVIGEQGEKGGEVPTRLNPTYEDLQKASPRSNRLLWGTVWALALAVALGAWVCLRLGRRRRQPIRS
jgi:hypothetical protein